MSEDGSYTSAQTEDEANATVQEEQVSAASQQGDGTTEVPEAPIATAAQTGPPPGGAEVGPPPGGGESSTGAPHAASEDRTSPFTRSKGKAPAIPPIPSKADQAAKRRGEAAAQFNVIRGLLDTAAEVVDVVAQELARGRPDPDTLKHDLEEFAKLYSDIETFDVNRLASVWRAPIRQEVTAKLASLTTARIMLQAQNPTASSTATSSSSGTADASTTMTITGASTRRGRGRTRSASFSHTPSAGAIATRGRGAALGPKQSRLMHMALNSRGAGSAATAPRGVPRANAGSGRAALPPRVGSAPPVGRFTVPPPAIPSLGPANGAASVGPAPLVAGINLPPPSTAGGLAAPSWQLVANRPYAPNADSLGEEFYLTFPYPWNSLPQAKDARIGDILKIASQSLPTFDGERGMYITWRNSFIPGVHLTTIDITYKVMLLRGSNGCVT